MKKEIIDKFLDEMPSRGIPLVDFVATQNGKTVYERKVNMPDPNRDICFVCSISKVTTCVAAMRLYEEGKIGLDDPVYKYLPKYKNLTVRVSEGVERPAKKTMTVRHLFTMTGGLNYNLWGSNVRRVSDNKEAGTLEVVNTFPDAALDFEPGERFQYSLCHDVLAAVCEVASGMRFADYVKKYILDPLGMNDTGYHFPEELRPRLARQYSSKFGKAEEVTPHNDYIVTNNYDSGGAGLYTTSADQIKLLTALACDGKAPNGYQLLKPETIALMEVGELTDDQKKTFVTGRLYGYSWGLCGRVHVDPLVSNSLSPVGEFGWDGATGSLALVDRKNHIAMYFGTHIYGCGYSYTDIHPRIRDMIYKYIYNID